MSGLSCSIIGECGNITAGRKYVIYVDEDDLDLFNSTFSHFPKNDLLSFTNGGELLGNLIGKTPLFKIAS